MRSPGSGEPLVLQLHDCTPEDFMVSTPSESDPDQMPKVTGIINWEKTGYLPKWRIATRPRSEPLYMVCAYPFGLNSFDWQWMLSNACVRAGFPLELEYITEWTKRSKRHYPSVPVYRHINFFNLPNNLATKHPLRWAAYGLENLLLTEEPHTTYQLDNLAKYDINKFCPTTD
jgi:hypothetical protein